MWSEVIRLRFRQPWQPNKYFSSSGGRLEEGWIRRIKCPSVPNVDMRRCCHESNITTVDIFFLNLNNRDYNICVRVPDVDMK